MMTLVVKVLMVIVLGGIAYQDIKDKSVYAILFLLFAILGAYLHYQNTMPEVFLITIVMNLGFTLILILMVYLYSKIKLHLNFKETIGLGDIVFFIAIALSFATITLIITFVFALIFSLLLHMVKKSNQQNKTVPLAGYMSLFYIAVFVGYWLGIINNVYL
uniref:hypothetical protein n=1 Tax=Gelidibacter sp. TaxID=2018083 RepID=UPI00404A3AF3